jgi:hypothetical protein
MRKILTGLRAETERLQALAAQWRADPRSRPSPRDALHLIISVQDVTVIGVRIDLLTWTGEDGPAARQAGRRALERLERAGLLERFAPVQRLTHARLTAMGRAAI